VKYDGRSRETHHIGLSDRQMEVSRGLLAGLSLKAIAIDHGISIQTASQIKTLIFEKFGLLEAEVKPMERVAEFLEARG
jgi:DNA-binding CsgD family transcriptional regulator